MTSDAMIILDGIGISLPPAGTILQNFSLRLRPGEAVALLGRNGQGKTTLLRIAAGLLEPDAGAVTILGIDLLTAPRAACEEMYHVIEPESVYDFLTFRQYAEVHRAIYRRWNEDAADRFCRSAGVPMNQALSTLSRGQRLKARLACAFASGTRFLVLDEPFESLDAESRLLLRSHLAAWRSAGTGAILYSAHRQEDSDGVASHALTLE